MSLAASLRASRDSQRATLQKTRYGSRKNTNGSPAAPLGAISPPSTRRRPGQSSPGRRRRSRALTESPAHRATTSSGSVQAPRSLRGLRRSRPSAPDGPRCWRARGAGPRRLPACAHLLVRVRSRHVRILRTARAPEDTLTVYPDWHRQASTPTLLAGTGHAWRLPPALIPVLPAGNTNDTSADLVIDAGGYPALASPNTRAVNRQPAFADALSSSALCGHLLTGPHWPGQLIAPRAQTKGDPQGNRRRGSAGVVRNCFQAGPDRRGAGSIPAACRICHTVEAAIGWPSLTSSPWHRRCPQAGLSVARRITSFLIAATAGGRPGAMPVRVVPPFCVRPVAGARPGASPGSPRTPRSSGGGGSAGTGP